MSMYNEITVTAELTNTEYMITKNYNLLENKPQINSVELIGNKSLEDLGINPDAEENVIDVVKVNGSALTPDEEKAVNVTVTTGTANGTVKVNGSDVAVKGLKSAAFTESTAYDAAGSAAEVQGNVDALTVVVNGKVDNVQGKGLSQNDFTNSYKSKLDGIEAGAQVNAVTSVAGKTGAVTLQKSDVGLGNVDNTSDLNKPISTATQNALNGKVDKETGKGLSTNDYTTTDKNKLAGIAAGATDVSISDTLAEGETLATITINGTPTAIKGSNVDVDDEISSISENPVQNKVIYDFINNLLPEKTATGNPISISDASGFNAKSAKVTMLPIQDLHGYDSPWAGGAGKNLADKATELPSDITTTVDNDGKLTLNGTTSNVLYIRGAFNCPDDTATYTWALFNSKAYSSGVEFSIRNADTSSAGGWARVNAVNKTFTFTPDGNPTLWQIQINRGLTFDNDVIAPMIVKGSEAPTSFEPYSNICPISGRDSVDLVVSDGESEGETYTATFPSTVYGGEYEFVSGKLSDEWVKIEEYDGETLPGEWISDRDVYAEGTTPTTGAQVVYKTTTTETTLTPQSISLNKGENVITTDGDNAEVKYSVSLDSLLPT